jgi:uncharacterized protein YgbK (DUF1537 family)
MMITVVADDITGAAEVAGIAFRYGLKTVVMTRCEGEIPSCDVLVVASDTRSMNQDDAAEASAEIVRWIPQQCVLFKKTDSALRGNVVKELQSLLSGCQRYHRVLFVPANPTKNRTITGGIYRINGIPIADTDFAADPEFPALSSDMRVRFPEMKEWNSGNKGIMLWHDAATVGDIRNVVALADECTMLAGAADLFTAFIESQFNKQPIAPQNQCCSIGGDRLIVCGSTQSKPLDIGIRTWIMPEEVFRGNASADEWTRDMMTEYAQSHSAIITIGQRETRHDAGAAAYLRQVMAAVAASLMHAHCPQHIIIEGGATAFALLNKLGLLRFAVTQEIAPGIVMMETELGNNVILKPGSYPWGSIFS